MQLPVDFKEKYQKLLGVEAEAFFASFDKPVEKGFRINPLKYRGHLHDHQTDQPVSYSDWGYYGKVSGKTIDHQSGLVYSQEPSAMLVGEIAHPKPGQKVLDLCAAPGGKTTYLASFMDQDGVLVSNEINRGRAKILAENVERFGIQNAVILNESPDRMEARFAGYFDVIVVDAPCSGEGMFRKDPDAMDYWSLDYPVECANRQKEILKSAMKMLAPQGELVYSTCTFAPEEDEQIIAWLLEEYPALQMAEVKKNEQMDDGRPEWANGNPELAKAVRLFPHHFRGEGHFMAKLVNTAEIEVEVAPKKVKSKKKKQVTSNGNLNKEQLKLWQTFASEFLVDPNYFAQQQLLIQKDRLYYQAVKMDLTGVRYIKPGLELGEFKKNRFEPSQSLLMAVSATDLKQVVKISAEEWQKYVHGDVLTTTQAGKGWVTVAVEDTIVGPGKLVQGTIKNFYPKGLRMNF
jgi:NOL1/NOP2/sun family putative RNA methylase